MCSRVNYTRVVENDTTKKLRRKEQRNNKEVFTITGIKLLHTLYSAYVREIRINSSTVSGKTYVASCEFPEPITSN